MVTDADRRRVAAQVAGTMVGSRPEEDDAFRATTDDDEAEFVRAMAEEAAGMLEGKPADRILAWAASVVPRFAVTSSFGAESAVMLHMVSKIAPGLPVFFLDTGYHFQRTLTFRDEMTDRLGLTVVDLHADMTVAEQDAALGTDLFATDPDRCCQLRKTVPLRRALSGFDGWATGVRRSQTPERAGTPVVEAREHDGRWLVKVAPLADWTDHDVDRYLHLHDLPRHPMVAEGYPSIGCAPCTSQVADGEDPRAGRWSDFGGKTECGIHLDSDGSTVRRTTTPG